MEHGSLKLRRSMELRIAEVGRSFWPYPLYGLGRIFPEHHVTERGSASKIDFPETRKIRALDPFREKGFNES